MAATLIRKVITMAILFIALSFVGQKAFAQSMGVSFSFFFPKNGYFSIPISPFSIRGLGVNLNRYVAVESGFSLYRMSGMSVTDVPFKTKEPIIGPTVTMLIPLELVLQFGNSSHQFRLKGGGFAFYNISSQIIEGNLDRALRDYEMWEVLNSDFIYDNNPGWGWQAGAEYIFYVNDQFGITLGASYFAGGSDLNLRGSYSGGVDGSNFETIQASFPDSRLDFTGWEISIGALFGN